MVWHLTTYAIILPWLAMYIIMILELQKTGIYMYEKWTLQTQFLHIKEVHSGMTYPTK